MCWHVNSYTKTMVDGQLVVMWLRSMYSPVQELHLADSVASSKSSSCWFGSLELWAHLSYLVCCILLIFAGTKWVQGGHPHLLETTMILIRWWHTVFSLCTPFVVPDTVWEGTSKAESWPSLCMSSLVVGGGWDSGYWLPGFFWRTVCKLQECLPGTPST